MLLALVLLAGGGVAMTAYAGAALYAIAWLPWPETVARDRIRWLGYFGLGALSLIGIVLTSYGFVLGRRAWKGKASRDGVELSAEGGEEETAPAAAMGEGR